jgi:hypothetical protein
VAATIEEVKERLKERNLMGDVGSSVANVPVHFPHDTDMLVTVEQ